VKKSKILQKIEQARSKLYNMNGPLTNPVVVQISQEPDEYIVAYYKEQGTVGEKLADS